MSFYLEIYVQVGPRTTWWKQGYHISGCERVFSGNPPNEKIYEPTIGNKPEGDKACFYGRLHNSSKRKTKADPQL